MTVLQRPTVEGPVPRGGALLSRVGLTVGAVAAGAVLYAVDPNHPGHYPTCPFLAVTGYYCPGCGSLRAMHDLLHGDVPGALARNPLAVLAVPFLLLAFVAWIRRTLGYSAPHPTRLPPWSLWLLLAVVLAYGVLRNLPGWDWLSPA